MKILLYLLFLTLVSCGGGGEGTGGPGSSDPPLNSPPPGTVPPGDTDFTTFYSEAGKGNWNKGNKLGTGNTGNFTCTFKVCKTNTYLKIFQVQGCSGSENTTFNKSNGAYTHFFGNSKNAIQNEINNLLNNMAQYGYQKTSYWTYINGTYYNSNSIYIITTNSGDSYGFDINLPISANPIYESKKVSGKVESKLNVGCNIR
jgi:hypothetical protein